MSASWIVRFTGVAASISKLLAGVPISLPGSTAGPTASGKTKHRPQRTALANCAIRMANSDDEAKYLSDKLRTETENLRSLPRGTFATFIRDLTPHALALKVLNANFAGLPRISKAEQKEMRERMRLRYSFSPFAQAGYQDESEVVKDPGSPSLGSRDKPQQSAVPSGGRPPPDDTPETGSTW